MALCYQKLSDWSGEGWEVEGECDTISGVEADPLGLLVGMGHASCDGVGPWGHLNVEVFTW